MKKLPLPHVPPSSEFEGQTVLGADDLQKWPTQDDPSEKEWQCVPSRVRKGEEGTLLVGHFEDIRRIDNLDRGKPGFWAAITSRGTVDARFPVDAVRLPMLEIEYRCNTSRACPAVVCHYPGGEIVQPLEASKEWVTAAFRVSHLGFPASIDWMSLRLYSSWRNTESVEFKSLRFRPMSEEERSACDEAAVLEGPEQDGQGHDSLKDFFPFGVFMNAESAQRLADLMDISFYDYWRLAFEDVARHHQNCVALEGAEHMEPQVSRELLALAKNFDIRVIPIFDWPATADRAEWDARVAKHIQPLVGAPAIAAWGLGGDMAEENLDSVRAASAAIYAVDPGHLLTSALRHPGSLPCYRNVLGVSWFDYFKSFNPWQIGEVVRTHRALAVDRPLWVTAPAFVSASDAPEWNTCPQMRMMLNQALANGAGGWFTFAYHNDPIWVGGHCERSLTGPFLTFSDLWAELGNRVERLSVIAPLFTEARPISEPPFAIELSCKGHPQSHVPKDVPFANAFWMRGADFYLCYIVCNDADQVVSVNLEFPEELPDGATAYDITGFVRTRAWVPMDRKRHLEMFPGQGQVLFVAAPEVCGHWRDVIAHGILEADRRQVMVDLDFAQKYSLDIADTERTIMKAGQGEPLDDLMRVHAARDHLLNVIYATPAVTEARSLLIKASAIICGCDEALSALHGRGRTEQAHELGVRVLPLAREMTQLRIKIRRGMGPEIVGACEAMIQSAYTLLTDIWSQR